MDYHNVALVRLTGDRRWRHAIEGIGVAPVFLGFTAPTGDDGQLVDLQLEAIAQRRSLVPGPPI